MGKPDGWMDLAFGWIYSDVDIGPVAAIKDARGTVVRTQAYGAGVGFVPGYLNTLYVERPFPVWMLHFTGLGGGRVGGIVVIQV